MLKQRMKQSKVIFYFQFSDVIFFSSYSWCALSLFIEASDVVDVQSIEHIIDENGTAGVTLQRITDSWDAERNMFVQQTGFKQCDATDKQHPEPSVLLLDNGRQKHSDDEEDDEYENFEQMLEDLLPDSEPHWKDSILKSLWNLCMISSRARKCLWVVGHSSWTRWDHSQPSLNPRTENSFFIHDITTVTELHDCSS